MNDITHWLDGSSVYGSSFEESESLRGFVGGKLKSSSPIRSHGNRELLPVCKNTAFKQNIESCRCPDCFATGKIHAIIKEQ